jgi:hypothetical protein
VAPPRLRVLTRPCRSREALNREGDVSVTGLTLISIVRADPAAGRAPEKRLRTTPCRAEGEVAEGAQNRRRTRARIRLNATEASKHDTIGM